MSPPLDQHGVSATATEDPEVQHGVDILAEQVSAGRIYRPFDRGEVSHKVRPGFV